MKKIITILIIMMLSSSIIQAQKTYNVKSPDEIISVTVNISKTDITYSVIHGNTPVINNSAIALKLNNGTILGKNPVCKKVKTTTISQKITSPFYKKNEIIDNYNELILTFKDNYQLVFRVYNEGEAYRFITNIKGDLIVNDEVAEFNFNNDNVAYVPYVNERRQDFGTNIEKQFMSSFENTYSVAPVSQIKDDKLMFLPILVELGEGKKAVITEADLEDYPGMYLMKNNNLNYSLKSVYATYPAKEIVGGHNMLQKIVTEREKYIAKTTGTRNFPWRIITISSNDTELADNDMVYKLASPSRVSDVSWIMPGKVAWDWWNDWNISGVPFKSGINNNTYRFYIDFASKNHIEYVILDEGWAVNKKANLFQVVPEINLKDLIDYANSKNVGIVLWAGYNAIDKDMDSVCKHYSQMGVKGFKVDFMDRDDQKIVNFYYRMAETAAKYHLLIDFHGAYKPTGLNRTYPNVLNHEGVFGLEQAKWIPSDVDLVTYEVTIPFIRMVAGPFDFTQGAMRNATKENFRAINSEPMSQGTRCRQLAEYMIFESPFCMLCDNPVNYTNNQECTDFISKVPTTWDETVVIDGKVGKYIVIARRKGNQWYIGATNNWEPIDLSIDISKLGNFTQYEVFKDGFNSDKVASDYIHGQMNIINKTIPVHLVPGGGAAIKIIK